MAAHDDKEIARTVREASKVAKLEDAYLDKAVVELLGTRHGRQFLWWMLGISRAVGGTIFDRDLAQMAFNAGEQNVGLQLMARIMEVAPQGFLNMQQEQLNDHTRRNSPADTDATGDPGSDDAPEFPFT